MTTPYLEKLKAGVEEAQAGLNAGPEPGSAPPEPQPAPEPPAPEPPAPQPAPAPQPRAEPGSLPEVNGEDITRNLSQALREERQSSRRYREQAEHERKLLAERLDQLQQAIQSPPAAPEPAPELPEHVKRGRPTVRFEDDAQAYLVQSEDIQAHQAELIQKHLRTQQEEASQREKASQQTEAQQQLQAAILNAEIAFSQEKPDYQHAIAYARQGRYQQLLEFGMSPIEAQQQLLRDETFLAANALKTGRSPAEAAYNFAVTAGYKPPAQGNGAAAVAPPAAPAPASTAAAAPTAAPAPATTPTPAPAPAQPAQPDMATLQAGTAEAQTLGAASGGVGAGKLTADDLLSMSQEDFNATVAKMSKAKKREIFGA